MVTVSQTPVEVETKTKQTESRLKCARERWTAQDCMLSHCMVCFSYAAVFLYMFVSQKSAHVSRNALLSSTFSCSVPYLLFSSCVWPCFLDFICSTKCCHQEGLKEFSF